MSEEIKPSVKKARALISSLNAAGVTLLIGIDGAILYRGPRSALTPHVVKELQRYRWEVLDELGRAHHTYESAKVITTAALAKAQASVRAARKGKKR